MTRNSRDGLPLANPMDFLHESLNQCFEACHLLGQLVNRLPFRIGKLAMLQHAFGSAPAHYLAWDADHRRVVRHWVDHYRSGADFHMAADTDAAEHLGPRADNHMVPEGGVALAFSLPVPPSVTP